MTAKSFKIQAPFMRACAELCLWITDSWMSHASSCSINLVVLKLSFQYWKMSGKKFLSLATFNVHMWMDSDQKDNTDRIVQLVKVLVFKRLH